MAIAFLGAGCARQVGPSPYPTTAPPSAPPPELLEPPGPPVFDRSRDDAIALSMEELSLTSPAFVHGDPIPTRHTCDAQDTSPAFIIADAPSGTESFALIVDDPDAPGGTWVHWVVWNIPSATITITAGSVPSGAQEGTTSFGDRGYGGPCPPNGTHRYFFRLYALDTMLELPESATADVLRRGMEGHVLSDAELMGRYTRR